MPKTCLRNLWRLPYPLENYVLEWKGLNSYHYDGLQPKMSAGIKNEHECTHVYMWHMPKWLHKVYLQLILVTDWGHLKPRCLAWKTSIGRWIIVPPVLTVLKSSKCIFILVLYKEIYDPFFVQDWRSALNFCNLYQLPVQKGIVNLPLLNYLIALPAFFSFKSAWQNKVNRQHYFEFLILFVSLTQN